MDYEVMGSGAGHYEVMGSGERGGALRSKWSGAMDYKVMERVCCKNNVVKNLLNIFLPIFLQLQVQQGRFSFKLKNYLLHIWSYFLPRETL